MPALTSLVLTDREPTPVNHTFNPQSKDGGIGVLVESTGVKLGDSSFSVSSRKTAGGRYTAKLKLVLPVVENHVVGAITTPTITRTAYATIEFNYSAASTTQERKNLVGMLMSALPASQTMIDKVVVGLEEIW